MNEKLMKWALRKGYETLINHDSTVSGLKTLLTTTYANEEERRAALNDYVSALENYSDDLQDLFRAILIE